MFKKVGLQRMDVLSHETEQFKKLGRCGSSAASAASATSADSHASMPDSQLSFDSAMRKQVKFLNASVSAPELRPGDLLRESVTLESPSLRGAGTYPLTFPDSVQGASIEQQLDVKISKIRRLVDWRINDLSRVLSHTEDAWSQQLDGERRSRQESVDAVQRLTETTHLMVDTSLSAEKSRLDVALRDLTDCQVQLKVLSQVTAEVGDDVKSIRKDMDGLMDEVRVATQTAQSERKQREESIAALAHDISLHKASMSQTSATQRSLIDELRLSVDRLEMSPIKERIAQPLQKIEEDEEHTDALPYIPPRSTEHFDAVQREHSERLELLLRSMEGLRQQQEKFVDMSLQQAREEWSTWLDAEKLQRTEASASLKQEFAALECFMENIAVLVDNLGRDVDEVLTKQRGGKTLPASPQFGQSASPQFGSPLPSAEILEATREGHLSQIASRLDIEQSERRDALRTFQKNLHDLQSVQTAYGEELSSLKNQLHMPITQRIDDELRDVRDAMSGLDRDMKAYEVTLRTATAEAKDQIHSIACGLDEVRESKTRIEERLNEVDCQQKESFECLQQDLQNLPAVCWDSMEEERERLLVLSKELDELTPKVDDVISRVEAFEGVLVDKIDLNSARSDIPPKNFEAIAQQLSAMREDVDAIATMRHDLKTLPTTFMEAVSRDEQRLNVLEHDLKSLEQRTGLSPEVNCRFPQMKKSDSANVISSVDSPDSGTLLFVSDRRSPTPTHDLESKEDHLFSADAEQERSPMNTISVNRRVPPLEVINGKDISPSSGASRRPRRAAKQKKESDEIFSKLEALKSMQKTLTESFE